MGQVRVAGPLAVYRVGFGEKLVALGYTPASARLQLHLLSHVSRWLASQELTEGEFGADQVVQFPESRRAGGYRSRVSMRGLTPLLDYLRGLGVVLPLPEPVPCTPVEAVVQAFGDYLVSERGLTAGTVARYLAVARLFLSEREDVDVLDLRHLNAAYVTSFVVRECRGRWHGSATTLVTGLRSLLRFLFLEGYTGSRVGAGGADGDGLGRGLTSPAVVERRRRGDVCCLRRAHRGGRAGPGHPHADAPTRPTGR